jgi:hypothetical protein
MYFISEAEGTDVEYLQNQMWNCKSAGAFLLIS